MQTKTFDKCCRETEVGESGPVTYVIVRLNNPPVSGAFAALESTLFGNGVATISHFSHTAADCYSGELRPQQIRIPANGTLLGTKIFQGENNELDPVSVAGAKLRDAEDKVLQGQ